MKKKVVFSSIFALTNVFYEISRGLKDAGHDIYWITTDDFWTNWLLEKGVSRGDILRLIYDKSDFLDSTIKESVIREIVRSEENADLTINQILMMDQFIKYKNMPDINEYIYLYYHDIKEFLIRKQVTHFFGEPTNSNEIISYMICRELGIEFAVPRPIRYPLKRMFFTDSYHDHKYHLRHDRDPGDVTGHELIKRCEVTLPTPEYLAKFSKRSIIDYKQIMKSIRNRLIYKKVFGQKNLTHHDIGGRIKLQLNGIINAFLMKYIMKYEKLENIRGKIAYFPMHVQPESSIDVMGSYFSDQLKLIKDIRRALPANTTLIIKEHPNFLDMNNYRFSQQMKRIPNVKFVKYDTSTFDVLRRSDIVFTVSGTTAYQAGLQGIPAVTFSPMFFEGLSSVHSCTNICELRALVYYLLTNFTRDYEADCQFMEKLIKNSYDAIWDNASRSPHVLEPENIKKLQNAFLNVITTEAEYFGNYESYSSGRSSG